MNGDGKERRVSPNSLVEDDEKVVEVQVTAQR
jgi:hypothetical protein